MRSVVGVVVGGLNGRVFGGGSLIVTR
jgi:hypothetical protein